MRTRLVFLILFLSYQTSTANQFDPCTFNSTNPALPSSWSYSSIDQVRRCFENIPTNTSIMNETMKQLFNSLDFYSFLSIVRESNAPYYMSVDLQKDLLTLFHQFNMNMYKTDYDCHLSIVICFKKLKDYHTKYFAPHGYAQFHLLLPFIFEYLPSTKQIKIQRTISLYSSLLGHNLPMNYTDRIVTKIDGINAFEYLKQFAKDYSLISKDQTVQLNSIFREEFWLRNLAEYPMPLKNNITFSFSDESEVTFPYLIIIKKQFDNQMSLEIDNRFSSSVSFPLRIVFNYILNLEKLNWYEQQKNSEKFDFVMGDNHTYCYHHKSSNTTIIRIESFQEDVYPILKQILLTANRKTLIIDLIGNHGGHSCLAYGILNYLVPEYSSLHRLYEPIDARTTKRLLTFSKVFNAYSNSIYNLQTGSSYSDTEWIQPYVNYTRGNSTDTYSRKWSINCDGEVFGQGQFWIRNETGRNYFQSIYVLTDGACGSACSLFLTKLKLASNFRMIYGIGGGYDNDLFESSSYAGGGAFPWNIIVTFHNQFNIDNSSINYLPTSAYLNLNVYEIYINAVSSIHPREFVKQSIDRRVRTMDYFNIEQALENIIQDDSLLNENSSIMNSSFNIIIILNLLIIILFLK
ncbi:hypothetical protein I4U23_024297 [Adineta vaga]|nr:hypothetical protein I4U23_024297 [Adineta vaga]